MSKQNRCTDKKNGAVFMINISSVHIDFVMTPVRSIYESHNRKSRLQVLCKTVADLNLY